MYEGGINKPGKKKKKKEKYIPSVEEKKRATGPAQFGQQYSGALCVCVVAAVVVSMRVKRSKQQPDGRGHGRLGLVRREPMGHVRCPNQDQLSGRGLRNHREQHNPKGRPKDKCWIIHLQQVLAFGCCSPFRPRPIFRRINSIQSTIECCEEQQQNQKKEIQESVSRALIDPNSNLKKKV